ncbi:unnamed protein product [Toxocara canis]|uniref:Calponin-homology (CH) domain-containing protein n=1 Tax=Toxocara canis TaxID=6265 RepID=A0A183U1V3_TOXCA|nr:unnamed protein product [Toxocara canis]
MSQHGSSLCDDGARHRKIIRYSIMPISALRSVGFRYIDLNQSRLAVVDGVELHGRVVVWKLLGALIGIYPAERGHAAISAGIDRWLLLANQVVEGRINGERACRCVNPALSRSDFLASGSVATMADVIMKAAVDKNGICFPNNVEMWLARVGQAMAVC